MSATINAGKWRSEVQKMADRARDAGDYLAAAELYEKVISLGGPSSIAMAAGHMRKEAKDFVAAERHYQNVRETNPDDPEIYMQLGHFYKTVGRYGDAQRHYMQALQKHYPNFDDVKHELRAIHESKELLREQERRDTLEGAKFKGLVAERLLPRKLEQIQRDYHETFILSRLGSHSKTRWGKGRTVRGVDAVRGHVITSMPCDSIDIFLDDELIYSESLQAVSLRWEKNRSNSNLRKYVFNAWIDFSEFSVGKHEIVLCANPLQGEPREGIEWRRETIIVAERLSEDLGKHSPAFIPPLDSESPLTVVEQVNRLPSLVRKVTPGSYPGKLDTVAVMRLDQLGDMVVTLPAMRRLREILPTSRIVGLVGPANAGLASTLGVFDDVIAVNFPDDRYQHKRVMDKRAQEAFAAQCKPYNFDLAIDFLYSEHANKLLPLTGAPVTMTVSRSDHIEDLEVSFDARSPSGGDCLSPMTHTAKARALSEALALWLDNDARPLLRTKPNAEPLARYGLSENDRYVVLHTGSSFAQFLRWPHYPELTVRLLKAGYKVVYMGSDEQQKARLPAEALEDGRIVYLDRKIPFDDLDALLSCATLMIGNDSGPKHWASLRGTRVVSLHPGRDDLREWGQVFGGVVLARRVPCAGCGIRYDETECGQDFACVRQITIEEVLREALSP